MKPRVIDDQKLSPCPCRSRCVRRPFRWKRRRAEQRWCLPVESPRAVESLVQDLRRDFRYVSGPEAGEPASYD